MCFFLLLSSINRTVKRNGVFSCTCNYCYYPLCDLLSRYCSKSEKLLFLHRKMKVAILSVDYKLFDYLIITIKNIFMATFFSA